ncbi:hypothetical protein A0H81_05929 [Grifola frondosa]|uniref:Uncharacterized protein n=1 Tax=Grifola frondosa TaxID=5627 RepID=A0A1C7MB77_GRIFR|nr:hypothetical protein A0H81_05929 [Grifola frondosa]
MNSQTTLQDLLQAEFSPLLDTSLIAAIVADHVSDGHTNVSGILPQTLQGIRTVLCELAAEAERDYQTRMLSWDFLNSTHPPTPSQTRRQARMIFSPLAVLRVLHPALIPQTSKLKSALDGFGGDTEDIDMAAVVEGLLTSEYLRELEERGLCGLDGVEIPQYEAPWQIVEGKKKPPEIYEETSDNYYACRCPPEAARAYCINVHACCTA